MKLFQWHRTVGLTLVVLVVNAAITRLLRANAKAWYWKDRPAHVESEGMTPPAVSIARALQTVPAGSVQRVELPVGHLVLYPATSLHHVTPVTRGVRICSFFWIQSMVRDDGRRSMLFDMDLGIQRIGRDHPNHPSTVQLTAVYHNLLRHWAEL